MTVSELCEALSLRTLVCPSPEREITGVYVGDLLSWVMGRAEDGDLWLTIMTNVNVIAVASLVNTSAVLLCEGCQLEPEVLRVAGEKGINVLVSDGRIYETCRQIGALLP